MEVYLDNASTTWPKPHEFLRSIENYVNNIGASPGRGAYKKAQQADDILLEARSLISKLFNVKYITQTVFTSGATESLNMAIFGLLNDGDHVISSSKEHNSVARPLDFLSRHKSVRVEFIDFDNNTTILGRLKDIVNSRTKMLIVNHASNVTGEVLDLDMLGRFCRDHSILFVVDASQTAGKISIDMQAQNIDVLAFSCHKGLYGSTGLGCLCINENVDVPPIKLGGTGGISASLRHPKAMPISLEAGTPNMLGIAGLVGAIQFITRVGIDYLRSHDEHLIGSFIDAVADTPLVRLLKPSRSGVGICSFNIDTVKAAVISDVLDSEFGIQVRGGLHCAPLAHQVMGTLGQGSVRVSTSYFNSLADVLYCSDCIKEIAKHSNGSASLIRQ